MRDDAKTELRCKLCDHGWLHGGAAKAVAAGTNMLPLAEARGRLIYWSNDLLATLVGDGLADRQHASQCPVVGEGPSRSHLIGR